MVFRHKGARASESDSEPHAHGALSSRGKSIVIPAYIIAFGVALAASLMFTFPVRRLALRIGMVDSPGPRKVHLTPIPLLGGLGVYCGVVLAIVVALNPSARAQMVGVLAGATLLAVVGFLDDRGLLHHQIKLLGAMPVAAVILIASGIHAHVASAVVSGPLGTILDLLLTLLWVVGVTAAFSILDHMDGLCAGVAGIAAGFFMLFAALRGQVLVSTLAAAAFGASIGFLRWNFSPAKIFLGDGGAMFLGFLTAAAGLKLRFYDLPQAVSWMIPVLTLGAPIFDTTLVSISRLRRGLVPFTSPGKDHAAHRLVNLGLSQRGAVLALYGLGVVFGLLAVLVSHLSVVWSFAVVSLTALAALATIGLLERAPYEKQDKSK